MILDPFLSSLGFLSQYKTYGMLLGFGHGLFEIIPDISALAQKRQADKGKDNCRTELHNRYRQLEDRICLWHYSQISASELDPNPERAAAALVYQNALLIFLRSSFYDSLFLNPVVLADVEARVAMSLPLLISFTSGSSSLGTTMLWPAIIIGSCCRPEKQRDLVREGFSRSNFRTRGMKRGIEILELLWNNCNPRAYGPRGLEFVMENLGISFSMI